MKRAWRAGWLAGLGLLVACGLPTAGTLGDDDAGALLDASAAADAGEPGIDAAAIADGAVDGSATGDGASPLVDAGAVLDGSVVADGGARDAAATGDSGVDAGACVPRGAEDCTNGLDDDCDGLVDCADSACNSAFTCVPEVPSGWSVAALAVGSRPGCPAGYATPRDVVMDPTGDPAVCACTCSSSGTASCSTGSATFYGPGLFNDCSSIGTFPTDVGGGACRNQLPFGLFGLGIGANANLRVTKVALTPNTCSGSVQKSVPSSNTTEGKRCLAQSVAVGGGCGQGFVCARKTSGQYQACIAKSGANVCPGSYPAKHDTGTGVTDTRNCSTCTCGSTASCGDASVTFFASQDCLGTSVTATADDTCRAMSTTGQGASSWRYAAPVLNDGCTKTTDTAPTGAITMNAGETVCCR